jgi:hypothetical protein
MSPLTLMLSRSLLLVACLIGMAASKGITCFLLVCAAAILLVRLIDDSEES